MHHELGCCRAGSVLVLVGDVDPGTAVAKIGGRAGRLAVGARARSSCRTCRTCLGSDLLFVPRPGAVQSQLRLSAQAITRTDPRYAALQLANLVFGGFFSSRLVENIREDKGYTYHARSSLEFTPARRDAAGRRRHGQRRDRAGAAGDPLRAGPPRCGAADGVRSGHRRGGTRSARC